MSLLRFEHVVKRYRDGRGHVTVLDDVSFDVESGDFVGLWGLRRSGKTTLLEVAAGREVVDEGRVIFDGYDMTRLSLDRRARLLRHGGIGLVSTDWRPARNKEAVEHVALPLLSDGMSLREARQRAWRVLERVEAVDCGHVNVSRLSQAERVRVAIAQALIHQPRLLLVDEPAVLLRPSEGVELYALLGSLGAERNLAVMLASEDVAPVRKARRVLSIDRGRVRSMDRAGALVQFSERAPRRLRSQP
jgi:putative ABC transport system ATP-binding protein